MRSSRIGTVAAVVSLLATCASPRSGTSASLSPQPGESWFDHLGRVVVCDYSESSLPESLRLAVAEPYLARTERLTAAAWTPAADAPPGLAALRDRSLGQRLFAADPAVAIAAHAPPPTILVDGMVVPPPTPESVRTPGAHVWWDAENERLLAFAERPPDDVVMEYRADPERELARFEMRGMPDGVALRRRVELARVTRDALLVPAGARLALDVACDHVDTLRVAFAVRDFARVRRGGAIEPARRASDGAVGVVEVVVDGARHRLFAAAVDRSELDGRWIEELVDLRPFRNRALRIELSTEPGAAGDPSFDYGLFADLRFEGMPNATPPRPDVVLIDLDTLRADGLSLHGNPRPTSPRIDAWARAHACIYVDARSVASWTIPSTISILSGTWVHQHGVLTGSLAAARAVPLLATLLRDAGYETIGRADGGFVGAKFGFAEGFDRFESHAESVDARMEWGPTIERVRSRRSARPLFLFLQTYSTHEPYLCDLRFEDPDARYDGPLRDRTIGLEVLRPQREGATGFTAADLAHLRRLYDAAVARTDERVGVVLEELGRALAGRDVLWILTSDHGEAFGEHGEVGHGRDLAEEVLRIPLIIGFPPSLAPDRIGLCDEPISSLDIVPTVLAVAGLDVPAYMPGRSLLERAAEPPPRLAQHGPHGVCIEQGRFKLVRTDEGGRCVERLFDLAADPLERDDLAERLPERAAALARRLDALLSGYPRLARPQDARAAPDAATLAELRALGYAQ